MFNKVFYNGQLLEGSKQLFTIKNRGFKYGDALFETIRMFEGKLPFLKWHFQRLFKGMNYLNYRIPNSFSIKSIEQKINALSHTVPQNQNQRIRLTIFRNDGGLYTPKEHTFSYIIEHSPLQNSNFQLNSKGIRLGHFPEKIILSHPLSNLKSTNSLPYILAAIYKERTSFDDLLLLNQRGNIVETISSNIFFIKKNTIITPTLSQGCVEGIMRSFLLENLSNLDFEVVERNISLNEILNFEAGFISNAIKGIQWIKSYKDIEYINFDYIPIIRLLNNFIKKDYDN